MNAQSDNYVEQAARPVFFNERPVAESLVRSAGDKISGASILACVDDAPASAAVVLHAFAVGRGLELPITLARVVETSPQIGLPADPVEWRHRRNEYRSQLRRIAALPPGASSPAGSILLTGAPADRLSDWAIEHRVPLLALATHGHSSARQNGLGPTAQRILQRAATSLLLVPPGAATDRGPSYHKVLVPLDGSCRAESVLPLASRIARAHGAEIVLAHVIPKSAFVDSQATEKSDLWARLVAQNEKQAREYLDELQAKLRGDGHVVSVVVAPNGDARPRLRRLAQEQQIDLIVLSSHGQSGLNDVPCGSVTEYLATHAPVPMLIVRPNFIHGCGAAAASTMPPAESGLLPS
ncbi:nucleotide-binding universal stress UspA family protein [Altererythrobacter atlanticus]|uniref:Universal stress protein n=1 Tax=Croceibacterium atlanticum TaxID=1267766 RepID=A0A0F7KUE2_9SPHN|nr:universal stress protein [Croceibacterium atlanticum]AKH43958.1 Putative universal stress protein [Croceibacterium atlanticum]MBB5733592.1 nucleotide-binding universal stress UspA family protein [Croceibacterium atlanticum]